MPEPSAATGRSAVVAPTAEPAAARAPRRDSTAADAASLERMGRIDPQPVPAPSITPLLEAGRDATWPWENRAA